MLIGRSRQYITYVMLGRQLDGNLLDLLVFLLNEKT